MIAVFSFGYGGLAVKFCLNTDIVIIGNLVFDDLNHMRICRAVDSVEIERFNWGIISGRAFAGHAYGNSFFFD